MKLPGLAPRGGKEWRSLFLRWTVIALLLVFGMFYITSMPSSSYSGPFEPLSESEKLSRDYLRQHVLMLADRIGERNIWRYEQLEKTAEYIEKTLADFGYEVSIQEYKMKGMVFRNIEVELTGTSLPKEILIVGAHYDSVMGSPGANDNGSGVAALFEIARLLAKARLSRTVRFVAFVNEEPPFYQTENMGSRVYASRSRRRGEQIVAMLSLETIGYYTDEAGSQHYPFPFSFFYPSTGNFIGFVGNMSSRSLLRQVIASFRSHTAFPSEGVAAPGWLTGIGWSDHWSFWKEGYPALMVTDTALFRYRYYHAPGDTADRIEYDRMARVVMGVTRVVAEIGEGGVGK